MSKPLKRMVDIEKNSYVGEVYSLMLLLVHTALTKEHQQQSWTCSNNTRCTTAMSGSFRTWEVTTVMLLDSQMCPDLKILSSQSPKDDEEEEEEEEEVQPKANHWVFLILSVSNGTNGVALCQVETTEAKKLKIQGMTGAWESHALRECDLHLSIDCF